MSKPRSSKRHTNPAGKDYEVGYKRPPVATRFQPGGIIEILTVDLHVRVAVRRDPVELAAVGRTPALVDVPPVGQATLEDLGRQIEVGNDVRQRSQRAGLVELDDPAAVDVEKLVRARRAAHVVARFLKHPVVRRHIEVDHIAGLVLVECDDRLEALRRDLLWAHAQVEAFEAPATYPPAASSYVRQWYAPREMAKCCFTQMIWERIWNPEVCRPTATSAA